MPLALLLSRLIGLEGIWIGIVSLSLLSAGLFVGCGKDEEVRESEGKSAAATPVQVSSGGSQPTTETLLIIFRVTAGGALAPTWSLAGRPDVLPIRTMCIW